MNGDPKKLISTLREQGKSDQQIVNMLMYSPEFGMDYRDATKALGSVPSPDGQPLETRPVIKTLDLGFDPFSTPEDEVKQDEDYEEGETDIWFDAVEDVFKDVPGLGDFADWTGDMVRSFKGGRVEAGASTELLSSAFGFGDDEDYAEIANRISMTEDVGMSDEAKELEKKLEGVEGSFERLAIRAQYKAANMELISRSLGSMIGTVKEGAGLASATTFGLATGAVYSAVGAGAGSIVPGGGTAVGGGVGFGGGFLKGAMGGLTAAVEAQSVVMEELKMELFKRGLKTNAENIELVFNDPEVRDRMQNRATARGLTIGAIDAIVGVGAGKATSKMALAGARKVSRLGVGLGIETAGAGLGEGAAQLIADGELNMEEIVLESLMEVPMGLVVNPLPTKYSINGKRSSAAEVADLVNSGEYLGNAKIEVKRDSELKKLVGDTKKGQLEGASSIAERLQAEANNRGKQLHGVALRRAVSHAYGRVTEAEAKGDNTASNDAITAAVDHVTTTLARGGVFDLDIDEQSSGDRASAMANSRYDSKSVEANSLESRARKMREDARSASEESKAAMLSVAESLENKAKEIRVERKEFYRKAALKESDTAKAIQQLDVESHNVERALQDQNLSEEAKNSLIETLKENVSKRLELEQSLESLPTELTVEEVSVSRDEQANKKALSMDEDISALESELESLEEEMLTEMADPDALAEVQDRLKRAKQERGDLGALVEGVRTAKEAYAEASEDLGGEGLDLTALNTAEKNLADANESLAAALGIVEDQQVSGDPSYSSGSQLKAHSENGGSTFSLSSGDLIGQKKSSVSIFPDRSKIVEGREITKEDIDLYVQENKDLFEGNEDVLAVGTWFDEQSNQTYLDVSAVVEKEVAIDLGKQYNQKAVFDLELLEEVETGGTGEAVGDLKPLQERVKDIRKALGVSPKETKETSTSSDTEAIDAAVEEGRTETEDQSSATETESEVPDSAKETPRASDGSPTWRAGEMGLSIDEAKTLNNLQKLLDVLGIKMFVYPDTDAASKFQGGAWGGLFDPKSNTVHISPEQIRENAAVESAAGVTRTKSFSETVLEEVIHAALPMAQIFENNPKQAAAIRKEIKRALSKDKALAQRIEDKAATYRDEGKSESVIFEEEVVEFLSALAADPSSINLKVVDRIRVAINKMMVMAYGAVGKQFAIKDTDSLISIAAKFSAAKEGRANMAARNSQNSNGEARASSMVSPASLRPDENGKLTLEIDVPTYSRRGGIRKEIGSHPITKTFRDQWHFINWWKKATDMGRDDYYTAFRTTDGKEIDVDRIKGYNSSRASSMIAPTLSVSEETQKKVAAAVAQGILGKSIVTTVRRRLNSAETKVKVLEKRGDTKSDKYKTAVARLNDLASHVTSVIDREAKAKGKDFKYSEDSSTMASGQISFEAIENGMSPFDFKRISESLKDLTGKKPSNRVVAYQAMFEHLMDRFPEPEMRKKHFFGLMGKLVVDPQLRGEAFGDRNPLNFFSDWHKDSTAKISQMVKDGTLTGTVKDNVTKLNILAAITSPKASASPNIESAMWMLQESESYKKDNPLGITETFIRRALAEAPGVDGMTRRSVSVGLRKLMSLSNGDLSEFSNVPVATKNYLSKFTGVRGNLNGAVDVDWKKLMSFLSSPYEGAQVKLKGLVTSQMVFGPKVGAWMVNLNAANHGDMVNSRGQKMSDIVTVDTHVLNTGALVLGKWYDAGSKGLAGLVGLRSLKDQMTDYKTDGFTEKELEVLQRAATQLQLGEKITEEGKGVVNQAALILKKDLEWATRTMDNFLIEGDETSARMISRAIDKVTDPQVSESNTLKRDVSVLVSELTANINEKFGETFTPAQVGQLIFADRQTFAFSVFKNMEGEISEKREYQTYATALGSIRPSGVQARAENEVMASNMLLFPSESRQDAADSPLHRNRSAEEVSALRDGRRITNKLVKDALDSDATSVRIMNKDSKVSEGQKVGVRLNLNVMKNTGVPVQTMHDKTASGEALRYSPAVMVKNPELYVNQNARRKIVTFQENKFPMASVNGGFITDQLDQMNFNGVKAFFNPFKHNVFVDASGRPIKSAEEATIIGSTVFLRGEIEYFDYNDPILDKGRKETPKDYESRIKRNPKYDKAVNRFAAFSKRQGVEFENRIELELAYDNMSIESKVALNESEVAANMEQAETMASSMLNIRRTAGRAARQYPSQRSAIVQNPNNYFTPQSIKDLKGELSEKADSDLVGMMSAEGLGRLQDRNDDLGVLAAGELINRAVSRGDLDAIPNIIEEAAAIGTTAGRLLRHLRELKSATPLGIEQVVIKEVERRGNSLSEDQKARLSSIAGNLFRLQAEHEALVKRAIAGEDVEADLKSKGKEVKEVERQLDTFTNAVVERGWGQIGTMLIQGNLLTPMSQVTNVGANMVNALGKVAVDAIALPVERLINMFGIESPMKRNYSINAYMYGLRKFGHGFVEALDGIVTGQEKEVSEWRVHRGFAPFRSLMSAMGKGDLPMGPDGKASLSQRMKLLTQGTLGIPAEIMFRFLSLGDVPFRRYVEGIELYQAGKAQGLEGEGLAQFIKHPTKKQRELAEREGRKLTYQEETGASKMAEDTAAFFERAISQGFDWIPGVDGKAVAKFLVRSNMPYIRTPANILLDTLTYVSPYIAGPRIMNDLQSGDARSAAQNFGKVMVGSMVAQTAVLMVKEGIISGAIEWDEDEEKNIAYDQFPPNSINISALKRFLSGESTDKQPDDYFQSYTKMGVVGAIMGAIVKGVDKDELRDRDYNAMTFPIHAIQDSFGVGAFSSIAYMMDQSFMQGMNTLVDVISSADATDFEKNFENWFRTTFQAVSATALPNTLSALYRGHREYLPDTRITKDIPLSERLVTRMAYTIKDRTFGLGDVPVRVNWKGQPITQTPRGNNGIAYQLFDITKSRQGEADSVSNEIWRLYEQTEDLTKVVGTPGYAAKRKLNVPNIKSKQLKAIKAMGKTYTWAKDDEFMAERLYLNVEQMNRLMAASGKERYAETEAFMATEKYAKMDDEEKVEALNKISENYNSAIEMDGNRFREHTKVLLEILQEIYDER